MATKMRRAPRQSTNLPAWIDVGNDSSLQRCTLVDVSEYGARLTGRDIERVPSEFTLLLSKSGQPRQRCNVVWKLNNEIGVKFVPAL
jgi:PilZ domain